MDRLFNTVAIVVGIAGGIISSAFGGFDILIKALLIMTVLDYILGVIKAIYNKELSSEIGFKGLIKKFVMFLVVVLSVVLQKIVGDAIIIRDITIMFFIANEGISILENAAVFIPLPDVLKNTLMQLRDKDKEQESEYNRD
ncbi:MAG: phage holin family protein [Clostridia bacterium]|nr:phage holin family protein [Clostridia bacterium]